MFDRHLRCLLSAKTKYVTVSHVWAPAVSKLQNEYAQALALDNYSEKEIVLVVRLVLEVPVRIYAGIVNSLKPEDKQEDLLEVWHDYASIPQWCHERKGHVIEHIPVLYISASFVVPYFYDLAPSSVQAMRKGPSTQERVQGIFDVCNSRWFRRTWTAMEYAQSCQLRPMLQNYKLLDEFRPGFPFTDEPDFHWREVKQNTSLEDVTRLNAGTNVLPYYLGSPEPVRTLRLQRRIVPFAECFKLISRRQATVPVDFIHALLGLTEPLGLNEPVVKFSELPHNDLRKSVSIIAKARLRSGDFSPLFMMPRNRDADGLEKYGFVEFVLFGLGMEQHSPEFPEVVLSGPGESRARLKAQNLGTVTMAKRFWRHMDLRGFNKLRYHGS